MHLQLVRSRAPAFCAWASIKRLPRRTEFCVKAWAASCWPADHGPEIVPAWPVARLNICPLVTATAAHRAPTPQLARRSVPACRVCPACQPVGPSANLWATLSFIRAAQPVRYCSPGLNRSSGCYIESEPTSMRNGRLQLSTLSRTHSHIHTFKTRMQPNLTLKRNANSAARWPSSAGPYGPFCARCPTRHAVGVRLALR